MPTNVATENYQNNKRRDKPAKVREANKKMRDAWELGTELIEQLGMFSGYGTMKNRAEGNNSLAEKFRKYRGMADRLSETEVRDICSLCEKEERAWGPTFLVELARLSTARERRQIAKKAIRNRYGLIEFKRQVRLKLGSKILTSKGNNKNMIRVGRKRLLNWENEQEILDEMSQLCIGLIHFKDDLEVNGCTEDPQSGMEKLPRKLREQFLEASQLITELHGKVEQRMKRTQS